jgi:hypothetical protein
VSAPDESADEPARPSGESRLPGEDSRSTEPEDARHWAAVYRELLRGVLQIRWAAGGEADDRLRRVGEIYARRLLYWSERRRSA